MSAAKNILRVALILPVLGLSACGEGYEMVPYHGSPYDNERTAGAGVEYVLAKMLPKKGVKEESAAKPETKVKEIVDEEMPPKGEMGKKAGDEIFNKKLKK